jgi:DDE domain
MPERQTDAAASPVRPCPMLFTMITKGGALSWVLSRQCLCPYAGVVKKGNDRRHRFPPEIIGHVVYLYFRFTLRYRAVEELLAVSGIVVSYETIRRWCLKFRPHFAAGVRRLRQQPRDHWHLDEVHLRIAGRTHYLWRAVDADGRVVLATTSIPLEREMARGQCGYAFQPSGRTLAAAKAIPWLYSGR